MRAFLIIAGILCILGALWSSLSGYINSEIMCAMTAILCMMALKD